MQYLTVTTVLAALSILFTLTTGSAIHATDPTLNAVGMQWTGLSKGVNITLNGTASQIAAQLKALDPDWAPLPVNTTNVPFSMDATFKRTDYTNCCPVAAWNWQAVPLTDISDAIKTLTHIGGDFTAVPNACNWAECVNGVGIWFCVEANPIAYYLGASHIASYVSSIVDSCPSVSDDKYEFCGQRFSTSGQPWNVILHGATCPN